MPVFDNVCDIDITIVSFMILQAVDLGGAEKKKKKEKEEQEESTPPLSHVIKDDSHV